MKRVTDTTKKPAAFRGYEPYLLPSYPSSYRLSHVRRGDSASQP
ncbi:MAG: hypothetical protein V4773_20620 [Verrucomicrobiota bacterium]